jgi:hypothetical protein
MRMQPTPFRRRDRADFGSHIKKNAVAIHVGRG